MKKMGMLLFSAAMVLALSACAKSPKTEGKLGDTMKTYFFNYTVNEAYAVSEFEGYTPEDGNVLVVTEVTVKNTFEDSIEMYDTDFQIQWGSDGEDDYRYPITIDMETGEEREQLSDEQLPALYTLEPGESRTGLLVYEIPEGNPDCSISYMEYFSDESTGDTFFVFFTVDDRT